MLPCRSRLFARAQLCHISFYYSSIFHRFLSLFFSLTVTLLQRSLPTSQLRTDVLFISKFARFTTGRSLRLSFSLSAMHRSSSSPTKRAKRANTIPGITSVPACFYFSVALSTSLSFFLFQMSLNDYGAMSVRWYGPWRE